MGKSRMRGSSIVCLILRKKVTASLPSINRYYSVICQGNKHHGADDHLETHENVINCGLLPNRLFHLNRWSPRTCPLRATGRSNIPCMPKIADWGGLMIGVPNSEPKTPPLEMVKVPPSISSTAKALFFAFSPIAAMAFSISA